MRRALLARTVLALGLLLASACRSADEDNASVDDESSTTLTTPGDGTPEPPNALASRLEALIADRPDDASGCRVGLSSPQGRAEAGFGLADIGARTPIDAGTRFDIASNSKQFTGAMVTVLAATGRLSLADPVAKHVPRMARYPATVTVAQLLHHTSGIPEYFKKLEGREAEVVTQSETIDLIADSKPETPPGSEFAYTNSNYVLLAEVVASVTKRPFADVLASDLLAPAGMTSAFVSTTGTATAPDVALSYDGDSTDPERSRWQQYGDGAVHATVTDLLRWGDYLLGARAGSRTLLDAMTDGAVESGDGDQYGAGLIVGTDRGRRVIAHSGIWLGFRSELLLVPEQKVAVVVLCNGSTNGEDKLRDAALALVL